MEMKLLLIPLIGFVIGYFTNYIAIKMLFYPRKSVLGFQGILPKRRREIAERIGNASLNVMPDAILKVEKVPVVGGLVLDLFKKSVERKVNSMELSELEGIIQSAVRRELRFITFAGGLLGFLIGVVEVLIIGVI